MATKTDAKTEAKPAERYNPMADLVTVNLPKATGREENFVFVGLNGKGYTILKGRPVRVPRPVYDILQEAIRQERRMEAWDTAQRERANANQALANAARY